MAVRVEVVKTNGTFSLDGQDFDVDGGFFARAGLRW